MAKAKYTHLTLVVDRSGSMSSLAADASGGINSVIKEQLAEPGDFTYSIVEFDTHIDAVARMSATAMEYRLIPRGSTALFDAIHVAYANTEEDIAKLPESEKPENIIFMIVTDGFENASRENSLQDVRALFERGRAAGWDFQFLAADEAVFQAEDLGVKSTRYRSSSRSVDSAYRTINEELKRHRRQDFKSEFMMASDIDDDFAEKYEKEKDADEM